MFRIFQKFIYLILMIVPLSTFCQTAIDLNSVKFQNKTEYIFFGRPTLYYLNPDLSEGDTSTNSTLASITVHNPNYVFTIIDTIRLFADSNFQKYFVIKFAKFVIKGPDYKKRIGINLALKYNLRLTIVDSIKLSKKESLEDSVKLVKEFYTDDENDQLFAISESDMKRSAFIYSPVVHWEFAYGTVTELVRYRPRVDSIKGVWNSDVNFGISVGAKYSFKKDWGITPLLGFGITKVVLDSISTRGFLGASKEHPALTPSLNILLTYKNFSLGIGAGLDNVNRDSKEVTKWVYNNRLFFGFAFGINIFSNNDNQSTTAKPSSEQATKK